MKVAYFGYDLLKDCLRQVEKSGCEIVKIFTFETDNVYDHNTEIEAFAAQKNLPFQTLRPRRQDIENLKALKCDLLVSAGYAFKIPADIIPGINIHPTLLPEGRGPWPMPHIIQKGLKRSGVSIHKISGRFDRGDLLLQEAFTVDAQETLPSLTKKIQTAASNLLFNCLTNFESLWKNAYAQEGGSYWPEPSDEDRTFTPDTNLEMIERMIRAFTGYGCYLRLGNTTIKIIKAECIADPSGRYPEHRNTRENETIYMVNGGYIIAGKGDEMHV